MARGEVVYFDHDGSDCKDRYHRRCTGRWRPEFNLEKLEELHREIQQGVRSGRSYTVAKTVDDWPDGPMADRAEKTIKTLREILDPATDILGQIVLRGLTADQVSKALIKLAQARSTRTVRDTRANLVRVITYAQARGLVSRNVASLVCGAAGEGTRQAE